MRKIGLILLLMFGMTFVYATGNSSIAKPKNSYVVLTFNKAQVDTMPNTINMDSAQIVYFNHFLNDPVRYYERDNMLQSEIDSLRVRYLEFQKKVEMREYNTTEWWVRVLLFSLVFLLVVIILYLILRFRGLRDEIVDIVTDSDRIKKWIKNSTEKPSITSTAKSYDSYIHSLQNENRSLTSRVAALEDALRDKKVSSGSESVLISNQQSSPRPVESQKLLYADSIIEGVFSHVREQESDDTVFVLKLKSESKATITLYELAYNSILANASFLEGCEKQIIGNSSVKILREGEAEMVSNGKWRVVSPLKVEIR